MTCTNRTLTRLPLQGLSASGTQLRRSSSRINFLFQRDRRRCARRVCNALATRCVIRVKILPFGRRPFSRKGSNIFPCLRRKLMYNGLSHESDLGSVSDLLSRGVAGAHCARCVVQVGVIPRTDRVPFVTLSQGCPCRISQGR